MLPKVSKPYQFNYSLGVNFIGMPPDWIEMPLELPLFNFHGLLSLPWNFSAVADINTLLITNQFRLGVYQNRELGRFSFNVGLDGEWAYGRLHWFGFDSRMAAVILHPSVSAGILLNGLAITVQMELPLLLYAGGFVGEGDEVELQSSVLNGFSMTAFLEQRYWKQQVCTIGLRVNYLRYYFPAWMSYPTFDNYTILPELIVAFNIQYHGKHK